ncbi:MAG: TonB-dependent receptor [Chloroflexota bacterium]
MKFFFIVAALFAGLHNIASGQGIVTGKVEDDNTREPLAGVYVVYGNNQGTITAEDGSYSFETKAADLTVTFRFLGYREVTKTINISPGQKLRLDVTMQTEIREIGQIVVSANRSEERISELTVSMDLLKPADFSSTHITDTKELITKTPGIEVIDGQASIRGGTGFSYGVGSRVLALIDGLPVLSPDAGNIKWQFLPLENISQVEIIKGASSVLYGSSALNGIINFRTAPASKNPDTRFFAETGVFGKPRNEKWIWWDSPRIFSTVSFSHLQKAGKNDIGVGLNFMDNNSYRKFNDETLGRLSLRFRHYDAKTEGLSYGMNVNSGYTDKTDFVLWENAETGALKQDTSSISDLHGSFLALDPFLSFNKGGKITHDFRFRLQSTANRFPVRARNNSSAYSGYGEYQGRFEFSELLSLIAGFAANYSNISSSFYGDHQGLNLAGFAQAEANPLKRLKILAGIRMEQNSLDGINDRLVPIFRTGINWQAAEYTYIRGSFGQGYRYPSVAEKFASTTLGAIRIVPNPDIKSETGWSSELGVKQGLEFGKMTGQADLALFLSRNKDLIEYIFGYYPDALTALYDFGFRATNVEQSRIMGYELELMLGNNSGILRKSFSGGYTYINPVEINPSTHGSTGKYLKYRRKHSLKLSAGAGYRNFDAGLSFYYRSATLAIDEVFTGELTREKILPGFYNYWLADNRGYVLLDGNLGYRFSEKYTLSFAVKNLTNTEYMGRPGDIQPQRNFSLRFEGKL